MFAEKTKEPLKKLGKSFCDKKENVQNQAQISSRFSFQNHFTYQKSNFTEVNLLR